MLTNILPLLCLQVPLALAQSTNGTETEDFISLTSLIESGKLVEARILSVVSHPEFLSTESYSGYLTVNKTTESHTFFWYFPVKYPSLDAPVVLWLQGGPGASSLYGLFTEIGPFQMKSFNEIKERKYSWHNNYNLVFFDNPVGTGFSTTKIAGLRTTHEDVGLDLHRALTQFFDLFPELTGLPFYIAGESYAGKYIPSLAHTIDVANLSTMKKINLQGLLIGNGFVDPINQLNYADYLYNLGLIDEHLHANMQEQQNFCADLISKGNYKQAGLLHNEILISSIYSNGITNVYDYLVAIDQDEASVQAQAFLNRADIQKALHVSRQHFDMISIAVNFGFAEVQMQSVANLLSDLLSKYRVITYNGQLDIIVAYPLTVNYLSKLNFSAAKEYSEAERFKWFVDGDLSGYFKVAGNLTEVMVRNAGHMVPTDQPKWAYEMLNKFISNEPFY